MLKLIHSILCYVDGRSRPSEIVLSLLTHVATRSATSINIASFCSAWYN